MPSEVKKCPICNSTSPLELLDGNNPNIVLYMEVAKKAAGGKGTDVPRSIISHVVRNRVDKRAPLTSDILANILKNNSLPTPAEQANNFVTFLGENLSSPGGTFEVLPQQNPSREKLYGLLGIQTGPGEWKETPARREAFGSLEPFLP